MPETPSKDELKKAFIRETLGDNHKYANSLSKAFDVLEDANIPYQYHKSFYLKVASSVDHIDKLIQGFIVLKKAGITYQDSQALYQAVIDRAYKAIALAQTFEALKKAGITYQDNQVLYQTVIDYPEEVDKLLVLACETLYNAGITFQDNQALYQEVIKNATWTNRIAPVFVTLNNAGITFQDNSTLYKTVVEHLYVADKLAQAFVNLRKAGFTFQNNSEQYQIIIEHVLRGTNIDKLTEMLIALKEAGITPQDNPTLYKTVVEHFYVADLAKAFTTLRKAGIVFEENPALYQTIIEYVLRGININKLEQVFIALKEAGITSQDDLALYQITIQNHYNANKLLLAFEAFKKAGITFQNNPVFYQEIISYPGNSDKLALGLEALKKAGITFQDNPILYQAVIKISNVADKLPSAFEILKNAGISYQDNPAHYQTVIDHPYHTDNLPLAFLVLKKAGITFQNNQALYQAAIKNTRYTNMLPVTFETLKNAGITFQDNPTLYHDIVKKINSFNFAEIEDLIKILKNLSLPKEEHRRCFTASLIVTNTKLANHAIKKLVEAKYDHVEHKYLFLKILDLLATKNTSQLIISKTVRQLCDYAKNNPSLSNQEEIEAIVARASSWDDSLTLGPLNKSEATYMIEGILQTMCDTNIEEIKIFFEEPDGGYHLKLPNQQHEISLSLLLRNANLSHLVLKDELIDKIDNLLERLIGKEWKLPTYPSEVVKKLPEALQKAILLYTGYNEDTKKYTGYNYKDINKMFRAEKQEGTDLLHKGDDNKNLLATFLVGCLLNDVANKVQLLDKELAASSDAMLVRDEILSDELIKRRAANPITTSAVTSFTVMPEGVFHNPDIKKTQLEGSNYYFVINEGEGEVLVPHGEQFITTEGPDYFISRIVTSPSVSPGDHFWSETALEHAYKQHLSQESKDGSDAVMVNGKTIARANHGLPHTYRGMILIEQVIDYFAHHAKDEDFKQFCQSITNDDIEWLRVAAAFSVTGRECEVHSTSDLDLYYQYRAASVENFHKFVENNENKAMIKTMENVLLVMGNPYYEIKDSENLHPNKEKREEAHNYLNNLANDERQKHHFHHRLLSVAHNLDGARCYSPEQYKKSISLTQKLVNKNAAQKEARNTLIRYNTELIKAHGDMLWTGIDPDGKLVEASLHYQPPFEEASLSLKRVFELSETVPKPQVHKPFQFGPKEKTPQTPRKTFLPMQTPTKTLKEKQPNKNERVLSEELPKASKKTK